MQHARRHAPHRHQPKVSAFNMQCFRVIAIMDLQITYDLDWLISKTHFDMVLKYSWLYKTHVGITERTWWDGVRTAASLASPEADFILVLNHPALESWISMEDPLMRVIHRGQMSPHTMQPCISWTPIRKNKCHRRCTDRKTH